MAVIAVSGASGFVGSALCAGLGAQGHEVRRLVRPDKPVEGSDIRYAPGEALDPSSMSGCDVLVHLAGESIAGSRWTDARKRAQVLAPTRLAPARQALFKHALLRHALLRHALLRHALPRHSAA